MMSHGIRVYLHTPYGRERLAYNVGQGLKIVARMRRVVLEPVAVGCEEGAMVAHYVVVREERR